MLLRTCLYTAMAFFLWSSVAQPQPPVGAENLEIEPMQVDRAADPPRAKLTQVPFTDVLFDDVFWSPKLKTNRESSLPHIFDQCEKTGRIDNFSKAAKLMKGKFVGHCFNDSDVYKTIESAAYSLATHPDPKLEKKIDAVVAKIVAAQLPDGYLNTYYTLGDIEKRWTKLNRHHELYIAGNLFEAGAAYYRATGKRPLLDAAIKNADHIDATFGPNKRPGVPGHPEIEMALVNLYEATGKEKYLKLANHFIDSRGKKIGRPENNIGEYAQDHNTLRKQSEVKGHAVRAVYLYSGVTDAAAYSGDTELIDALKRLWRDMVDKKLYITGGIGSLHKGEAFGEPYHLPNDIAYCETCASIGLAFWAKRMNLLLGEAEYADILEQSLYNGVISGVSLDGKRFFYVNPLFSDGTKRGSVGVPHRQPFFSCACCPPNLARLLPALPGYAYAVGKDGVYVNLYAAGTARMNVNQQNVFVKQETSYPWDGRVELTVEPEKTDVFALCLRMPGWCERAKIAVNDQPVENPRIENGYARLHREWKQGDKVALYMPMPVERIEANPNVKDDVGRVALRRGPLVYCFETADNGGLIKDIVLADDPKFKAEHRGDLLGGITAITGKTKAGKKVTAVPYHAWDNREPGEMIVWVRQDGKTETPADDPAWKGLLYRPYKK